MSLPLALKLPRESNTRSRTHPASSVVFAQIVDHPAVVRKLSGRVKRDLTAQLGNLAYRSDDRIGAGRAVARHLDVQYYAIAAVPIVDDEPRLADLHVSSRDF